jgi:hypothetical protein
VCFKIVVCVTQKQHPCQVQLRAVPSAIRVFLENSNFNVQLVCIKFCFKLEKNCYRTLSDINICFLCPNAMSCEVMVVIDVSYNLFSSEIGPL